MLLKALMDLSGRREEIEDALKSKGLHGCEEEHWHEEHHHAHHAHGRSWSKVRKLITHSSFSDKAKETALSIYQNIAEAEAQVHGETLETVHFHEVGRDEAILNALGIGMALECIKSDRAGESPQPIEILTSPIYDGKGTVVCSHGEIPVPVPAVLALMQRCSYRFETADVETEMVTPSGLAGLMGIGAKPSEKTLRQLFETPGGKASAEPEARIIAEAEAKGSRDTGREGLKVYLIVSEDE